MLKTIWGTLKASCRERARYGRWALQPRLADHAMLLTLDHGVKKGLAVAAPAGVRDSWSINSSSSRWTWGNMARGLRWTCIMME